MRFKTHNSTVKKPSMPFRLDTRVFIPLNVIKMESSFLVPNGQYDGPNCWWPLIFNPPELLLENGDSSYAVAFATPLNNPGVKIICRKLLDHPTASITDYPLSNALDEIDAYIVFDHAFIPWSKVFVENNVEMSNRFFIDSGMFSHTSHQDEVRGITSLELATSLALRLLIS